MLFYLIRFFNQFFLYLAEYPFIVFSRYFGKPAGKNPPLLQMIFMHFCCNYEHIETVAAIKINCTFILQPLHLFLFLYLPFKKLTL